MKCSPILPTALSVHAAARPASPAPPIVFVAARLFHGQSSTNEHNFVNMQTIEMIISRTSGLQSWSMHIGTVSPKQLPAVAVAVAVARKPENFADRTFGLYFS